MVDSQKMFVVPNWSLNLKQCLIFKTPLSLTVAGSLWVPNKCLLLTNQEECIDYGLDTELCFHPQGP